MGRPPLFFSGFFAAGVFVAFSGPAGTVRAILQGRGLGKGLKFMPHYIALIHKDADSCYGVSFPDVPGVFTAGDTIDVPLWLSST